MRKAPKRRELIMTALILVTVAAVGARAPIFVTPQNLLGLLTDTSLLSMLVLAEMVVLLTRGIDLSVASNLALTGMAAALTAHNTHLALFIIITQSAVLGLVLGLINGFLVAIIGIPSIVVTLGTLAIYRGVIFFIIGNVWLPSDYMPSNFKSFPYDQLLGIPHLLWFAITISAAMWVFLNYSTIGRAIYAVGGNPVAAQYCGIDLTAMQILVFAISGTISGLCGYLWVARYGIAYYGIAQGFEFTVVAACVIGGVSFTGGIGSVPGALLGALFLGVIVNALPVLKVSPFWEIEISGLVILAAVIINAQPLRARAFRVAPREFNNAPAIIEDPIKRALS